MTNEINQPAQKLVGVEVSQTALRAVCLNEGGAVLDSTRVLLQPGARVSEQLMDFLGALKQDWKDFRRVGIALPGLLNRETNRIELSTHIPEHAEIDLAQEIKNITGLDAVLENDANAAAHGEYLVGAGRGSRNMFYITLGTGIGGAFIIDGRLWRGAGGFAGELGSMVIDSEGTRLEDVASTAGIVARVKNRASQDHSSVLRRIRESDLTVADVVRAAQDGDGFAQMMLRRTGTYVGTVVAGIINLLNIEKIVLGGEIMLPEDVVLPAVAERAGELSFRPSFRATEIVAGKLGESAPAVGAAFVAREN